MEWLRGDRPRLVLDGDLAAGLGYVLRRGAETTEAATRVRVVLDRAAESSLGYVIRTAYPTP